MLSLLAAICVQANVSEPAYLSWPGFTYRQAGDHVAPVGLAASVVGDTDDVPLVPDAPTWRIAAIIFPRVNIVRVDNRGVARMWNPAPPFVDRDQVAAEFTKRVRALTRGAVNVQFDWITHEEPIYVGPKSDLRSLTEKEFASENYFNGVRLNNGNFDADDHKFRGPYSSCFVFTPTGLITDSVLSRDYRSNHSVFDANEMLVAFVRQVNQIRRRLGSEPGLGLDQSAQNWRELADLSKANESTISRWKASGALAPVVRTQPIYECRVTTTINADGTLTVTDTGLPHCGELALPVPPPSAKALRIIYRQSKSAPVGITFVGEAGSTDVTLTASPAADGWSTAVIDLGLVRAKVGAGLRASISTPDSGVGYELGNRTITFKRFEVCDAESTPVKLDTSDEDVQLAAIVEFAKRGVPNPILVTTLAAKSPLVQLNAARAFQKIVDPTSLEALYELSESSNIAISEAAILAMGAQKTPESLVALKGVVLTGISDITRALALSELAKHDASGLGQMAERFLVSRSAIARRIAVEALARSTEDVARRLRVTFLLAPEPEVKLAVTRAIQHPNAEEIKKLIWSSVNEPSDAVRLASFVALTESDDPTAKAQGREAMSDDSWWVRQQYATHYQTDPLVQAKAAKDSCYWVRQVAKRPQDLLESALIAYNEDVPSTRHIGVTK